MGRCLSIIARVKQQIFDAVFQSPVKPVIAYFPYLAGCNHWAVGGGGVQTGQKTTVLNRSVPSWGLTGVTPPPLLARGLFHKDQISGGQKSGGRAGSHIFCFTTDIWFLPENLILCPMLRAFLQRAKVAEIGSKLVRVFSVEKWSVFVILIDFVFAFFRRFRTWRSGELHAIWWEGRNDKSFMEFLQFVLLLCLNVSGHRKVSSFIIWVCFDQIVQLSIIFSQNMRHCPRSPRGSDHVKTAPHYCPKFIS